MDYNSIKEYSNNELQHFFQKNEFPEVAEMIAEININGAQLLELKQFELLQWKIDPTEKRKFLSLFTQIQNQIEKIDQDKVETKHITLNSLRNSEFKSKLEAIMRPQAQGNIVPFKKIYKSPSPTDNSLPTTKVPKDPPKSKPLHDDDGYLILTSPIEPIKEVRSTPPTKKAVFRFPSETNESTNQRKPMVLPRESVDDLGYLQAAGLPRIQKDYSYVNTQRAFCLARKTSEPIRKIKSTTDIPSKVNFYKSNYFKRSQQQFYDTPYNENVYDNEEELTNWISMNIKTKKDLELFTNSLDRREIRVRFYQPPNDETDTNLVKRPLPPVPYRRKLGNDVRINIKNQEITNSCEDLFRKKLAELQIKLKIRSQSMTALPTPPRVFPEIQLDPIINKIYNEENR